MGRATSRHSRAVVTRCSRATRLRLAWLCLRERYLSLRLFADLDAVIEGCRDAWNRLLDKPGRLASLTNYPYLEKVGTS